MSAVAHNCVCKLVGHKGEISKVIFNPQGSRVLTASIDKTARLWDSTSGECLQVGWCVSAVDFVMYFINRLIITIQWEIF